MTGRELDQARQDLGLSLKELAELLETPYQTVQEWAG